jgi:hypothetical protein
MPLSEPERVLRAKIAAYSRWAHTIDRTGATSALRAGFDHRFQADVDRVDPEHKLSEAARAKLLKSSRSLYFSKLAFARVKAAKKKVRDGRAG